MALLFAAYEASSPAFTTKTRSSSIATTAAGSAKLPYQGAGSIRRR
jgi:hypothetical protein